MLPQLACCGSFSFLYKGIFYRIILHKAQAPEVSFVMYFVKIEPKWVK